MGSHCLFQILLFVAMSERSLFILWVFCFPDILFSTLLHCIVLYTTLVLLVNAALIFCPLGVTCKGFYILCSCTLCWQVSWRWVGLHFSMCGPVGLSCFCGSKRQLIQGGIFGMAGFKRSDVSWVCLLSLQLVRTGSLLVTSGEPPSRAMCHEVILI